MQPPLGATWTGSGVQFSVYSSSAERVELCLFDRPEGACASRHVEMTREGDRFVAEIEGLGPGAVYGYRVHGPYAPKRGLRHNPRKLLIDPYARRVVGPTRFHPSHRGARFVDGHELGPDDTDSGPFAPRSVVVDCSRFEWGDDRPPAVPWPDTVLYECHVKGMTASHPDLPPALRGSYLGLCSEPVIAHLRALGVTTLSLLPIHETYDNDRLTHLGLTNYWGYSTLAFFALRRAYASADGRELDEFREMVKRLHAAGLEVLIDVVYNHSAETDELGSTLCLRGFDNAAYYMLAPHDRSRYQNHTGCGNTLDLERSVCRRLVLDSLRYLASDLHVDGFRFDLAPALARAPGGFRPDAPFLAELLADPVLSSRKLVAEPWDIGPGGYCLGRFPEPFREWNDLYRDGVRRFVRGDGGARADLATRLSGSSDVFGVGSRPSSSSVNFMACHDGFTLWDSQSYERKHNLANGEGGRDGRDDNISRNLGVEGESTDPRVLELRSRSVRSMLAILACSQGVPMLGHGDELGRTQRGNNNAYCHDSELTWVHWQDEHELLGFASSAFSLRARHPALRSAQFLHGRIGPDGALDLSWLRPDGQPMRQADWLEVEGRALAMLLSRTPWSGLASGVDALLCLFNAAAESVTFRLPARGSAHWQLVLDSSDPRAQRRTLGEPVVRVAAFAVVVLELSGTLSPPARKG